MSKLNDLIKQYCPDGVEYKRLKEISFMERGTSVTKKQITEGTIPVISGGKEPAYYCDTYNRERETITVAGSGAGAGYVQYWSVPIFVCDAFSIKGKDYVLTKYIYYCLSSLQQKIYATKKGGGVPHVHISSIENFEIPVPTIEIQKEIIAMLDSFTNLTAELTAELTARRAQYEYYRDKLLTFDDETAIVKRIKDMLDQTCGGPENVEYKQLSEIFDFRNGYTPSKSNPKFWENGIIPWFRLEDIRENGRILNDAIQHVASEAAKGDIFPAESFIVSTSATIGEHALITVPFLANQRFTCLTCKAEWKSKLDLKYVYYALFNLDKWCKDNIRVGNFASVDMGGFAKWRLPVPPRAVQEEISRILDKFNTLTTDISTGLPAEISLRQKQYEHYRDRLLNFNGGGYDMSNELCFIKNRKLGDIAKIVRGASPRPIQKFITTEDAGVNWIKIGDIMPGEKYVKKTEEKITVEGASKSRRVHPGDFILSNSMSFGRPYIMKIDGCIHDGWLSISSFEKHVTSDYLYHLLMSSKLQAEMRKRASFGGAVQNLNSDIVKNLEVAIPPIEEQKRITAILDKFESLCNGLSEGLPAEIEARKKQYEYYRDKLLDFKEKKA